MGRHQGADPDVAPALPRAPAPPRAAPRLLAAGAIALLLLTCGILGLALRVDHLEAELDAASRRAEASAAAAARAELALRELAADHAAQRARKDAELEEARAGAAELVDELQRLRDGIPLHAPGGTPAAIIATRIP